MTTKRSGSPFDLCNFVFADGRGCCMPSVPSLNGYCRSHGTVLKSRPPAEHNEDLLLAHSVIPSGMADFLFRSRRANVGHAERDRGNQPCPTLTNGTPTEVI